MTNNKKQGGSKMKQTAIDWLIEKYIDKIGTSVRTIMQEEINQAKEMERQQIIDACNQTEFEDIDGMGIHETISKGEQYYNEIYVQSTKAKEVLKKQKHLQC